MMRITSRLLAAARQGRKITVHGDYDVDGVCSTSIWSDAARLGAREPADPTGADA